MREASRRLLQFTAGTVGGGIIAGILWALVTPLPGYVVDDDLGASMSERGLASVFAADAWFILITGLVGLAAGIVAWLWFHRWGWGVCVVAIVGALVVSLLAWGTGTLVVPGDFDERLASAGPGDVVPVALELRGLAGLLMAPFMAITPVMLLAAFWPEPGNRQPAPGEADHASA